MAKKNKSADIWTHYLTDTSEALSYCMRSVANLLTLSGHEKGAVELAVIYSYYGIFSPYFKNNLDV
jgi:hypothetical protein